jgi:hypothetical protein
MDTQTIINFVAVTSIGVGGWFAREIWDAVKELRDDIHEIETNLPKEYVLRVDLDKRMDHIEAMFQRIYDKLDNKQDRV